MNCSRSASWSVQNDLQSNRGRALLRAVQILISVSRIRARGHSRSILWLASVGCLLVAGFLLVNCGPPPEDHTPPSVERVRELPLIVDSRGLHLFDLRGIDWHRNGPVRLRRWSSYIPESGAPGSPVDSEISANGQRILLQLPTPVVGSVPAQYGLRLPPFSIGYRLVPGDSHADAYIVDARIIPRLKSRTLFLTPRVGTADRLELRLIGPEQTLPAGVARTPTEARGPLWQPGNSINSKTRPVLMIGSATDMRVAYELNQAWYAFILGAFILIGLSYLSLWFARRMERSFLLFGLFCLLAAIVVSLSGDRFLFAFLNDSMRFPIHSIFVDRLQLLTIAFVAPVFLHFICDLFPGPRSRLMVRIAYAMAAAIGTLLIIVPPPTAVVVLSVYRVWSLLIVIVVLVQLIQAWRQKKPGARLALPGVGILVVAGVYDMFAVAGTEHGGLVLFAPALFLFVLIQGAMLSTRFAWAFAMFESISHKLQRSAGSPEDIENLHAELDTARGIQQSLIPVAPPDVSGLRIAARYRAMQIVGGDFYDFRTNLPKDPELIGGQLGVLLADVSGHGIPAALIVSMVKLAFWYQKEELPPPGTLFDRMNDLLRDNISGEFVTGCYAYLDLDRMQLTTSNAGHPPLLVWKRSRQELLELRPNGRLLGLMPDAVFDVETIEVEQGDRVILYTDGVYEASAADGSGEQYGLDRLRTFIAANQSLTPNRFADRLMKSVIDWSGGDDHIDDDIAFVVIDVATARKAKAARRFWPNLKRTATQATGGTRPNPTDAVPEKNESGVGGGLLPVFKKFGSRARLRVGRIFTRRSDAPARPDDGSA